MNLQQEGEAKERGSLKAAWRLSNNEMMERKEKEKFFLEFWQDSNGGAWNRVCGLLYIGDRWDPSFPTHFSFSKKPIWRSIQQHTLMMVGREPRACPRHLLPDAAIIHKCQLMIAAFFSNHNPHASYDDLEIVRGYCGGWNGHHSSLKPKK